MAERKDPDDVVLSPGERLALQRIAAELSADRRLARRMEQPHPGSRRLWLPLSVAALACASLVLGVAGIRTSDPAVICCFAALWPVTLVQGFRLLCRIAGAARHAPSPWL
ncbi:DUF3040 domain-containing protein [Streptomyces sp. NPDC001601]|uniref:DUF3040 domain-containing protein n=1 Tax=Streptomyces sp. NPDC001601 TaxID=3364592 RepID=UPI003699CE34